jgi:hypothetical protein
MKAIEIRNFIIVWVVLIGVIFILSESYSLMHPNLVVRSRINPIEAFANPIISDPKGEYSTVVNVNPSTVNLEKPREPYSLLTDILPPFVGPSPSPTSEACYNADFQKRLERTGNFRQWTNNYKRGVPDSCSAPQHELLLSFYKVEELPFAGYINS